MYHYKRLRDLREDSDITQKDLAKILKDTQQHYQLYESGKREPPFWVIIKLAEYYNVSIDYIAGLTNNKGQNNNNEEQNILKMYNSLSEKRKGKLELFLEQLTEEQEKEHENQETA